ncbi:hypothetical protein [Halobacillus sp. BBL2006]|uniref:hypothetical protein n=1 Tax=Halobacillus sp. BBL2006 TaxID=1543706 RepID=UPI0006917631|nr:hypothetical protein [Halobacillus sp. BBL2006]
MKRIGMLFLMALFLTGCMDNGNATTEKSEEEKVQEEENNNSVTEQTETTTEAKEDTFIESPQAPDDSKLTEIGATYSDPDGKIKLLAYAPDEQQVEVGPIKLTIHEAKYMHYKPSPDMIDFFHGFTHEEGSFNYVKLRVTVENTYDQKLNFAPVSHLETNTGEKKGINDDFYLEELHGDYEPGEIRKGQLGFILEETDPENLEQIKVQSSDVFQGEKSVEKGKTYTISF